MYIGMPKKSPLIIDQPIKVKKKKIIKEEIVI